MSNSNHKVCPICRVNLAVSEHHIKPRAEGGTDTRRNKVKLCNRCHDIVEEIQGRTGMEYSLGLIKLIQLEYGFTSGIKPIKSPKQEGGPRRPKTIRFITHQARQPKGDLSVRTCARCGNIFQPVKDWQALCQACSKRKEEPREYTREGRLSPDEKEFFADLRTRLLDAKGLPEF